MTNLSPELPAWRRRLTRERVLVGVPVLVVLVVVALLAVVDGWPRLGRMQEQQERLEDLRRKQASLPGLQRQLPKAEIRAEQVALEQALLVDLIAGRGRIQTFLAQLSREAAATGVLIELYEPVPATAAPAETSDRNARNNSRNAKAAVPKDPLTGLGYSKTSVLLQVQGPYTGIQSFLRRMEALQLLVQPSDLALRALEIKADAKDSAVRVQPLTELKLRLSFFDKTPAAIQS
ncbi:hypothetical protein [Synechococcus sp. RS9916]|uniref:hypothetical protein n=1 Tax=Synechococcus sp. RS9916 TaxID=221359 RepID=UPI0000E535A2|nr:hypothetical protein [Synechococcus sp. RS9916]EAU75107.1 hypothetical protein RS9916_36407 [Synechococcus sp. RS9916]